MASFFSKIFSDPNEKFLKGLQGTVDQINQLEKKFESFSDADLRKKTEEFKKRFGVASVGTVHESPLQGPSPFPTSPFKKGEGVLDEILPEVFALVRESAKRTIGQRHFDEQIMAGIVLHQGKIAEQKTGEGKTLSATLAVALNALTGRGVHIVTVNDYLARRDTNWMGSIYHLLGLSVACINHEKSYLFEPQSGPDQNEVTVEMENLREISRRQAYQADILYGTNNEFGFDYLRDNLAQDLSQKVQRGFTYAIVDEVDSILIDEARTPLIISAPDQESTKLYQTFARIVPRLKRDQDYEVNEKERAVSIQDSGIDKVEKALAIKNIYSEGGIKYVHQLEQALRAHALFKRDRDYLVKDNQVIIIDEFTGRLMPGRRFSEGLHQALEAKEGVRVQEESRTLASITFQNYFRMYQRLAGMTGTALSSAEEFDKVYHLGVVVIPTHKALVREDLPDWIYRTEKAKFQAIIKQVKKCQDKGQPVLIGTRSVERNEYLSALLRRTGISHEVLNAKNHEREAQIIAQAGRPGAVTVATNMAGRGVDIVLGGKASSSHSEFISESQQEILTKEIPKQVRDDNLHQWQKLNDQVIKAGGLCVIGTERHEARRIDDQLRGRSGRQGDPGRSQFFVSLEDELMRVFGGDRLKSLMAMLKVPEDIPIENKIISRTIEKAQARVEGYHFDSRKHTLEYDDVLNQQRQYIYQKRNEILESGNASNLLLRGAERVPDSFGDERSDAAISKFKNLRDQILTMIKNEIGHVVEAYTAEGIDIDGLIEALNNFLPIPNIGHSEFISESKVKSELLKIAENKDDREQTVQKISDYLFDLAQKIYDLREKQIGQDKMQAIAKFILLRTYDIFWMEHLDNMEHLRQSVSLRAYGQRDPLAEYKNEGSRLFQQLLAGIRSEVVNLIFKIQVQPQSETVIAGSGQRERRGNLEAGRTAESGDKQMRTPMSLARDGQGKKPGRNDPCPCGAIKPDGRPVKYKHCHGGGV